MRVLERHEHPAFIVQCHALGVGMRKLPHPPEPVHQRAHCLETVAGKLVVVAVEPTAGQVASVGDDVKLRPVRGDIDARQPCGIYFGTSGGQLFASDDAGDSWRQLASYLPRVLSVKAVEPGSR